MSPQPPAPAGILKEGYLPKYYKVRSSIREHKPKWLTLSASLRERFCRICGIQSSSNRTRLQHQAEVHVGKRCHFPDGDGICGQVFRREAHLMEHLDEHCRPLQYEANGKIKCGWARAADCPQNQGVAAGFGLQESMFRHVRKHQVEKAKRAGDVRESKFYV